MENALSLMKVANKNNAKNVSVSVLVLAWNHGEFIRQTLESITEQNYSEGFEILIGEDSSSDQTLVICLEFQERFPDIVKVIAHSENIGMHANFRSLWEAACGEHIAFCEGDDYWTDPLKLKKQVEFLRSHPECNLCGALTTTVAKDQNGVWSDVGQIGPSNAQETYSFEELIARYNFHFSSVMLRKSSVEFPDWLEQMYCVDRPIYLLSAQTGRAGFISEPMSVYRLHDGGNWSAVKQVEKAKSSIELFTVMRDYFDQKYRKLFDQTLGQVLWSYISFELLDKDRLQAKQLFFLAYKHTPLSQKIANSKKFLKLFVRLYMPKWYLLMRARS